MILAAQYARVHRIPYLGICLGMQMAIVEFVRHVLGYEDANSIELAPSTGHPVIALMPDQEKVEDLGGTLRLGSYPCILAEGSRAEALLEQGRSGNATDTAMRSAMRIGRNCQRTEW